MGGDHPVVTKVVLGPSSTVPCRHPTARTVVSAEATLSPSAGPTWRRQSQCTLAEARSAHPASYAAPGSETAIAVAARWPRRTASTDAAAEAPPSHNNERSSSGDQLGRQDLASLSNLVGYVIAGAYQPNPQGIEPCLLSLSETGPVISQSCSVSGASQAFRRFWAL
jgi:hypothetical protein